MTESLWRRKRTICEETLDTLRVLEPSMTPRKARVMFELHLPILMLAQISLQNNVDKAATKKEFQKGLVTLKLALKVSCHIDIACTLVI